MNTFLPSLAATSQNPNSAVLHIKHGGRLFREGECHKERKEKKKRKMLNRIMQTVNSITLLLGYTRFYNKPVKPYTS